MKSTRQHRHKPFSQGVGSNLGDCYYVRQQQSIRYHQRRLPNLDNDKHHRWLQKNSAATGTRIPSTFKVCATAQSGVLAAPV